MNVYHNIDPFFEPDSRVLLLGSMPSVASREARFFYAHKQNRMWRTLAAVFEESLPQSEPEKRAFLSRHKLAMWDVLSSCEIIGSSDSSIKNAVPNDIGNILRACDIAAVFTTGTAAYKYYQRLVYPQTGVMAIALPSTSAANARMNLDALANSYRELLKYTNKTGD